MSPQDVPGHDETEPIGYVPVEARALVNLATGAISWPYGIRPGQGCAVCTEPIGPPILPDIEVSDDVLAPVFAWTDCYAGPAGIVCADCVLDIDPTAVLT